MKENNLVNLVYRKIVNIIFMILRIDGIYIYMYGIDKL